MFTLTPLPYDENALEPHISAETMSFHYGKHHKSYVDKLNSLLKDDPLADSTARRGYPSIARSCRAPDHLQQRSPNLEPRLLLEFDDTGRRRRAYG